MVNRFLAIVVLLMTQMSAANAATKTPFAQKVRVCVAYKTRGRAVLWDGADGAWCGCVCQVFFRLFLSLIYDITAPDRYLDPFNSAILGALVDTFHSLRPSRIPQFAFAWLELVSHRAFMPKVRTIPMSPCHGPITFSTLCARNLTRHVPAWSRAYAPLCSSCNPR